MNKIYAFGLLLWGVSLSILADSAGLITRDDTASIPGVLSFAVINHDERPVYKTLDDSVLIMGPPSSNGAHPGVVRLHSNPNQANSGSMVRFQEWSYLDGKHVYEVVPYLELEKGRHIMSDGSIWEVGTFALGGTKQWKTHDFLQAFTEDVPRLFLTAQTANGWQAVSVRAKNVTQTGFEAALFEEEKFMDGHKLETIAYLAIYSTNDSGSIELGSQDLPYVLVQQVVSDEWQPTLTSALKIEEEQSVDVEVFHIDENIDVLSLSGVIFAQDVSSRGGNPMALRQEFVDVEALSMDANLWRCAQGHFGLLSNTDVIFPFVEPPQIQIGSLWEFNCSGYDITSLKGISALTALVTLNLSNNQLSNLAGLSNLTALTALDLSNNFQLSDVTGLSNLPALTALDLSDNFQLSDVTGLSNLPALTALDLSFNNLGDVTGLSNLPALTALDLSSNFISDVTGLSNLPALTTLDLSFNPIDDVTGLSNLPALTVLDLSFNNLGDVTGLSNLPALTVLDLSHNFQLSDVTGLSNLPTLTMLDLSSNSIGDVTGFSNLPALTTLGLSSNSIGDVTGLSNLPALTTLDLSSNSIGDVTGLSNLPALTTLNLSSNFGDVTGLSSLPALTALNLSFSNLSDVTSLSNLFTLTALNLSFNYQLSDVAGLSSLSALTYLDLSGSSVTDCSPVAHVAYLFGC